jgi:2-oxo-4-hydroxy-4-carboxy-5-ureidoimidazoline decarboxylase
VTLTELNGSPDDELMRVLLECCDVPAWARAVAAGRPYSGVDALLAAADAAARDLRPADVERALAAHPRIGERPQGEGTSADWSRREQAAVDPDERTRAELLEGNRAYEDRFGRVFLICASGLSVEQVLAALRERLANEPAVEDAVVADELRKIALLRLRRVVDESDAA